MAEVKLTKAQIAALKWLSENRCCEGEWLRDGKRAFGNPEAWNQHAMRSKDSEIIVATEDHFAIRPYVNLAWEPGLLYSLNDLGRSVLAEEKKP